MLPPCRLLKLILRIRHLFSEESDLDLSGCAAMANISDLNPQLVKIKLPFSVVQLWNDLEIGQVVKLPATNDIGESILRS